MSRRWTMVFALVAGLMLAIGGNSLVAAQGQSATLSLASQNNSGIIGPATVTDLGAGKMRIAVQATGAGAGPQPAHIHEGTCANLNPAPKLTLASIANGTSMTEVDGSIQQLTSSPHAIHLHKSPDELPIYVACADIRLAATSSGQPAASTGAGPATSSGQPAVLPSAGQAGPAGLGAALIGLTLIGGGLAFLGLRRLSRSN